MMEITESEEQKEKRLKKSKQNLKDLLDTIKWTNIRNVCPRRRRETARGRENTRRNNG